MEKLWKVGIQCGRKRKPGASAVASNAIYCDLTASNRISKVMGSTMDPKVPIPLVSIAFSPRHDAKGAAIHSLTPPAATVEQ